MKEFLEKVSIWIGRIILAAAVLAIVFCFGCIICKIAGWLPWNWGQVDLPGVIGCGICIFYIIALFLGLANNS